jgi:hypothetical protein
MLHAKIVVSVTDSEAIILFAANGGSRYGSVLVAL